MRYGWFQQGLGEVPAEERALGLHGQPDAVRLGRTPGKIPAKVNLQLGKVVSFLLSAIGLKVGFTALTCKKK